MLPGVEIPLLGAVSTKSALVLAAVVAAVALGVRGAVGQENLPLAKTLVAFLGLGGLAFAGARLHFFLAHPAPLTQVPETLFRMDASAMHAPGALLLLGLAGGPWLRLLGLPVGRFADAMVTGVCVGVALARLGCFLAGCCFGEVCDLPWAVSLPPTSSSYLEQVAQARIAFGAHRSLPVHPLPLYFALVAVGIGAFLAWLRPRRTYEGQLAVLLLVLFSFSSLVLEFWRADHGGRIYWLGVPQLFWVSLAMTVASAGLATFLRLHHRTPSDQSRHR